MEYGCKQTKNVKWWAPMVAALNIWVPVIALSVNWTQH